MINNCIIEKEKQLIDAEFLTKLNLMAEQYNVKFEIDYETHNINFDGKPKDKHLIAMGIDRIYDEYKLKINKLLVKQEYI